MDDTDDLGEREWKLDLLEECLVLSSEYELIRDVLRGIRPLEALDEPSSLDTWLGVRPVVQPPVQPVEAESGEDEDWEEPEDTEPESIVADDDVGTAVVERSFVFRGQKLVASVDDDAWLIVTPAKDRLGTPLLSGYYRSGRVEVVDSAISTDQRIDLAQVIEQYLGRALARRAERRGQDAPTLSCQIVE